MVRQLTTYWQGPVGGKKSDQDTETVGLIKEDEILHPLKINSEEPAVCSEDPEKEGILLSSKWLVMCVTRTLEHCFKKPFAPEYFSI